MTEREKLIELICEGMQDECVAHCGYSQNNYCDKCVSIADYLLANGVIVPPCKIGDIVWYITGIHRTLIKSAIVEEIIINRNGVSELLVTSGNTTFENSIDIFYSTREEAEKALKEREENA